MRLSVVDANFVKYFFEQLVQGRTDEFVFGVNSLLERGAIALDEGGKAQQEYENCCRPPAVGLGLKDWIADQLTRGKLVVVKPEQSLTKALNRLGLPKDDHKWICIAVGAGANIIATEDIDLFDPTEKESSAKRKSKIKANRSGCVAKYCKKQHAIHVSTLATLPEVLEELDE